MRKWKILITLALSLTVPAWTDEPAVKPDQNLPTQLRLIPPLQISDDWVFTVWGWSKADYRKQDSRPEDYQFSQLRLNSKLQGPDMAFGLVLELADLQNDTSDNWLREVWAEVPAGFDGKLKLHGGFILLACGRGYSIAGPFKWPTLDYPECIPFASYGLGVQMLYESKAWQAIWDITGKTGLTFDSGQLFDRLESSAMVKRKFDQGFVGLTGQVSEDFARGGVFAEYNPKPWFIRAELDGSHYTDNRTSNQVGGYLLAGVQPCDWFRFSLIGMVNRQLPKYWTEVSVNQDKTGKVTTNVEQKHSPDTTDETVGLIAEFISPRQLLSVKAGYYWPLEDNKDGWFGGEVQVRF